MLQHKRNMTADLESGSVDQSRSGPRPVARSALSKPYAPAPRPATIDLFLDSNEAPMPCIDVAAFARELGPDAARRYQSPDDLERRIADHLGVEPGQVLVTAGGDQAIDLACRAYLEPGSELILPSPSFEMIAKYARLAGAEVCAPRWDAGAFPLDEVMESISPRTAMIGVVSPNNPTGGVATADDLRRLSDAAPGALLLVDLAYTEFADVDLTPVAIGLPNAVAIRTFSKAFGLAGLRVGYAVGPRALIEPMRGTASPYPLARMAIAAATEALGSGGSSVRALMERVRLERAQLAAMLREAGATCGASQGNFVLAAFDDPAMLECMWRQLADHGIAVRRFASGSGLENALRITCPGAEAPFVRLTAAIRSFAQEAKP